MNLQGSVIIVTGSATGLGSAVAKRVASKGANVVINYTKREAEAIETAEACRQLGAEAIICRADVSVDEDCRRMAAEAAAKWGRIDGLVNNAAQSVFASAANLDSLSADDFMRLYSVNVVGAYQMVRAAAPHLKATGQGSIVNVSSISAIRGGGSSIAYAASKGALNTMSISLAKALAPEIRVNTVCPGVFTSGWWSDGLGEERSAKLFDQVAEDVPLKSIATPESVAETVVWLLEGAAHMTGETLMIDAGMHMMGFQPR